METSSSSGNGCSLTNRPTGNPLDDFNSGAKSWGECSAKEQESIVRHFAPKVKYLALRLKARLPQSVELSELISAGTLGLMESFGKFKPAMGNKFETYAENRIKGAMLDNLRKLDWFPRSLRRRVKTLDEAIYKIETEMHKAASEEELAEKTGMSLKEVREGLEALQNQFCISLELVQDSISSDEPNREGEPFAQMMFSERIDHLAALIDELTPREKLVLSLYYSEELNMRETAEVMGITEGRVSQLHSQALARLRREFTQRHGSDHAI